MGLWIGVLISLKRKKAMKRWGQSSAEGILFSEQVKWATECIVRYHLFIIFSVNGRTLLFAIFFNKFSEWAEQF